MDRWKNKIVVVTGGTEGLGREIALAFARQSANVVVLARDLERIDRFRQSVALTEPQISISGISTDVTLDESLQNAIETILQKFRQVDVWINNVGRSMRAAFEACDVDAYREFMEINFYTAVRCSLAILPQLQKTSGHLVNIGSLASKTGWPLIAPYATSKHALSAFHHQLRLEGPTNIHYLEVCPGPLQRADAGLRYSSQSDGLDKSAAAPGGGVNLKGISPTWLAQRIEKACRQRKAELLVPFYTRFLFSLAQLFPVLSDKILLAMRKRQ